MPTFNNIKELEKYLQKQINETLKKEVAKQVKDEIQMAIDEVVYMSGEPEVYYRRGSRDGVYMGNPLSTGSLADQNEMEATLIQDGVLEVVDNAEPSSDYDMDLDIAIEYGYGTRDKWYNQPRPFMETAKNNMRRSKSHVDAMKEGLQNRGLNVV